MSYFRMPCVHLVLSLALTVPLAHARPQSAAEWQAAASADLDAIHAGILASHPGVIDEKNPTFKDWIESGYQQAQKLLAQVVDYETLLSVERLYATGFRDGHLVYSDDIRSDEDTIAIDGWRVSVNNGKYIVDLQADDWPVTLPDLNSEWLGCDARTPRDILDNDVAPFTNRQEGAEQDNRRAQNLWTQFLPDKRFKRCRFRDPGGEIVELPVVYRALKTEPFFTLFRRGSSTNHSDCERHNTAARIGSVLWIHAGNFSFQDHCADAAELSKLLKELSRQRGFSTIVFDVRGNTGGDSSIGDRIFDAATGGLDVDLGDTGRLARTFAQWRVSDVLLVTAKHSVEEKTKLYGEFSRQASAARNFYESVRHAKSNGEAWLNQPAGYRVTAADVVERHGHLKHFLGKMAIVTDAGCVSACLDFVDLIKQVPHSIQLGQKTGSDTMYIDTGSISLPSGNHVILPLKVWRNRLRANNEAYTPDIPLTVDMRDDKSVQLATLSALDR